MDDSKEQWIKNLEKDMRGNVVASMNNFACIIKNDLSLKDIVFDEMKQGVEVLGKVPWHCMRQGWTSIDQSCLELYIEREYGIYAPIKCREALYAVLNSERRHHPIKEYLNKLKWDGVSRVDNLLIDYLGAENSKYVRSVTRKTLVAAISRVYNPGIKFDNILVLCGPQGIGKSTLFSKLGVNWYSDSMGISDMKDKTASEKLQGIWIMELGELAGLKKVDVETVKSFLSRTCDRYRPTYGQFVENHPRTGIIVGTTNSKDGFLRDITGNRRFWPVILSGKSNNSIWNIGDLDIEQIWAEAYIRYIEGESLCLDGDIEKEALIQQCNAMETDPRQGIIEDYLEINKKERVCLMEIWCECLFKERQDMKKRDAYELEGILKQIGNWDVYRGNASGKTRIPGYGIQKTFVKTGGC
ncbi:MAG: hypothetical protein E7270_10130 [Lachnospiraceae bacterium]|nr:hypothetical protein [Lachnospiraceae bacterium]